MAGTNSRKIDRENMEKSILHPVMEYGKRQSEAIACMREKGFKQATLILLFATTDQVAWLADEKEVVGNEGFKAWVQKYLIDQNPALLSGATASDLWGARCGVLHTGAPESSEFCNGRAKRIYYSSNLGQVTSTNSEILVLSLEWLGTAFACGLLFFLDDLQSDSVKDERARARLARMLVDQPL